MKFGLKLNTEFPTKKSEDIFRTHVPSWISDPTKQIVQFLMREHIPMNITTKFGSNWPSGFGED